MFTIGQQVTVEQFYQFAPFGLELISHEYRECDCYYEEDDDDDECYCGSGEYEIVLRYSLNDFHPLIDQANAQTYSSRFPPGLTPKPGFIWDSSEYGIEQLYTWTSIHDDFVVHKLPRIKILKRKEL